MSAKNLEDAHLHSTCSLAEQRSRYFRSNWALFDHQLLELKAIYCLVYFHLTKTVPANSQGPCCASSIAQESPQTLHEKLCTPSHNIKLE